MDWKPEEENTIKRYLLDDATPEERQRVEERLLEDDDYGELLLLIEDELTDDYASGALGEREQSLFVRNFLLTPHRRENLAIAREVVKCAESAPGGGDIMQNSEMITEEWPTDDGTYQAKVSDLKRERREQESGWRWKLFRPEWRDWKVAVYALLILGLSLGGWWFWRGESKAEKAMIALNQAYREQRPLEARITGFSYAPFASSLQRGGAGKGGPEVERQKIDYVALDRAKILLFNQSDDDTAPVVLHALGKYYLAQKDFNKAVDQLKKAVQLQPESAQLHSDLGAALLGRIEHDRLATGDRRKEDVDEAFTHLNQALRLAPALLEALFNHALLHQAEGLRREARADWERYLQQDSNSPWAEEARLNLEQIKKVLGKAAQRQEQLYQDFCVAFQARDGERCLRAFSLSFSFNGNYIAEQLLNSFLAARLADRNDEAESYLRMLAYIGELAEEKTGDRFFAELAHYYRQARPDQFVLLAQARKLMTDANDFYHKSQNDRAVEMYEEARQLFARAGNIGEKLFAAAWIGHCHHQRSDTEQNLRTFAPLAPVCAERKYRWMEANALCGLANAHNSSGQFSQAIADCLQCGAIAGQLGDQAGVLRSRNMLGYFYYELGKHEETLRISEQARNLASEISADIRYSIAFYSLPAWSFSALGFHEIALAYQREAVQMAEESKSLRLTAYAYIYQALIHARYKQFDEAVAGAKRGVTIGMELKDAGTGQDFVHTSLLHLGHIYRAAGKFPEAMAAFNQVLDFYQHSKKQAYFYGAAKGRLLTLIAQKHDMAAREELGQVLTLYEKYRESIKEESNRNSFFDQEQNVYDVAIDFTYTRLNDPQQAYTFLELSRGRSLLDTMVRGHERVEGPEFPELLIEACTRPKGAAEIRRRMPDGVQLVEYAALEGKLIVWLISKNGVESRVLNASLAELDDRINRYLMLINQPPGKTDHRWREPATELHDMLIRPIEPLLDKQKQICIIPDKALNRLSFGALIARTSGRLLIEDYLLSYASSANVFIESTVSAQQRGGIGRERLLVIGNPHFDRQDFPGLANLSSAEKEATDIAAYYESPVLLIGERATKHSVLRELKRADVAHFALHYVPDPWSPMLSRMPLAAGQSMERDGALQMHELYRLKSLQPRLVVLSACQTRSENYYGGEGAIGISRPFEAAGVPLVIASLWPVDTYATSELMIAVHRLRRQAGLATVEALRAAQLEALGRASAYRHPYYWAAFIAVGGHSKF